MLNLMKDNIIYAMPITSIWQSRIVISDINIMPFLLVLFNIIPSNDDDPLDPQPTQIEIAT